MLGHGEHRENHKARSPGGCQDHTRCKQARQTDSRIEDQARRRLLQDQAYYR